MTCYVKNPRKGQEVKLEKLPANLELVKGETMDKVVDSEGGRGQVSWRLKSNEIGPFELKVSSGTAHQSTKGLIRAGSLFSR